MQPNPLILRGSFFGSYLHQNTGKKCFHLPEKRNFSLGKSVPPRVKNKKKNKIKCNVVSTLGGKIIPPREKIGAIGSQKRSLHNRRFVRVCDTRSDSTYLPYVWSVRSLSRNMLAKLSQKWDENEMMNTGQTQKKSCSLPTYPRGIR